MNSKNYTLRIDRNVLVIHVKGTWDEHIARQFSQDFKNAGRMLSHAPWADIVYFDEWTFSVPGAEPIVNAMLTWAQENNMTHTARIYKSHPLKTYQLNRIHNSNDTNFNIRQFECASEGFDWLAENGFSVGLAQVVA